MHLVSLGNASLTQQMLKDAVLRHRDRVQQPLGLHQRGRGRHPLRLRNLAIDSAAAPARIAQTVNHFSRHMLIH